jgi:uncharacterized protein (UPF0210 family)
MLQPVMRLAALFFSLTILPLASESPKAQPKVRAITAFIDIDAKNYPAQFEAAAKFLATAREAYTKAGFEVETIRIATQPFPAYTRGLSRADALKLLRDIDAISTRLNFSPAIGPAMQHDSDDTSPVDLLADLLAEPSRINATLITAGEDGIHWKSLEQAARLIKAIGMRSAHGQGNFNFAAVAMLKPYGPFFPAAYHLGGSHHFAIGLESANVVTEVFTQNHNPVTAEKALADALTIHLTKAESIAMAVAKANNTWIYAGIDPTPAPLGEVSIGRAMEAFTGSPFGSSGTMTAAAVITRAVQSIQIRRTGYAGLMIPVMEDAVLGRRWAENAYNTDSLLAYSSVCAAGLDTIPLPGDVTEARLSQILSDVATLAFKWKKPLAARLLPVPGRKAGEQTEFNDPRMANTTIHN